VILLKMIGMVDPYFIMPVYSISACFSARCAEAATTLTSCQS
jgi:hypothetical protein